MKLSEVLALARSTAKERVDPEIFDYLLEKSQAEDDLIVGLLHVLVTAQVINIEELIERELSPSMVDALLTLIPMGNSDAGIRKAASNPLCRATKILLLQYHSQRRRDGELQTEYVDRLAQNLAAIIELKHAT
ncbi:hypothetical protein [Ketogulonicigenium vulgare]|uniref:hypothetical protein n=1 Tax=Ketogulonicigenium vulgare TaxID=92945 RepID=UPI0023593785|nr:hypothetical protein [Ketogulonicigenium vulgare]